MIISMKSGSNIISNNSHKKDEERISNTIWTKVREKKGNSEIA